MFAPLLKHFLFFMVNRFMNMKQMGVPKEKQTKGRGKAREGTVVKRDRELEKKKKCFADLLRTLEQN